MVKHQHDALGATFAALADPTRRAILARLARGEATVGELARPFRVSAPAISKHLRALEGARLVARRRRGRLHLIQIKARPLREAAGWLSSYERFWARNLDALAAYLEGGSEREGRR